MIRRCRYNRRMNNELKQWLGGALADHDLGLAESITPLLAEASHRQFFRIAFTAPSRSLVLMHSPPALERNDVFVALAGIFAAADLPVPSILEYDQVRGFLLLSDLGPQALYEVYGSADEDTAMSATLALLPRLQQIRDPQIPPYSDQRLIDELAICTEWLVTALLEQSLPAAVEPCFQALVSRAREQPKVCIHRDYHGRNLLWNDGQLGIVDFQDALHGPYSYDLACLLYDCYYQWPTARIDDYRERARLLIAPEQSATQFQTDLEWMAIQRNLKAIGIFCRLQLRDQRGTHLHYVLPTVQVTQQLSARYPELNALHGWLGELAEDLANHPLFAAP